MSWPVRYGEVATLAQELLEGLSPPTLEMMAFLPALSSVAMDSERSFSCKNNLLFECTLVQKRDAKTFSKSVEGCRNGRAKNHRN